MNRLASSQVHGQAQKAYHSDFQGNLLHKAGVGTYQYGQTINGTAAGPHAVTTVTLDGGGGAPQAVNYQYDQNGNMTRGPVWGFAPDGKRTAAGDRKISYWHNDKPFQISEPATGAPVTSVTMRYGAGGALLTKHSVTSAETARTDYLGAYERSETTRDGQTSQVERHHFGSSVFTITKVGGTTTLSANYLLKDHLGSTEMVLDDAGNVVTTDATEMGSTARPL